jgi:hypothetical protein
MKGNMNQQPTPLQKITTLLLALIIIAACGGTAVPPADDSTVATMVANTLQAYQAQATPTLISTITPMPTLTVQPPATLTSTPLVPSVRIEFLKGTTQMVLTGQLQAGQTLSYALWVSAEQPMVIQVDSANQDAKLSIRGANGIVLLPASSNQSYWQGLAPTSQDYFINLQGSTSTVGFSLNLTIMARIRFAAGETRTVLKGLTEGGYAVSYVVHANQGQKMDVTLSVPPDSAALSIWGLDDGQPYARAQSGITDFSLNLPTSQDYVVAVVPFGGATVEYNLTVRVK